MRALIMSDSHGWKDEVSMVVKRHEDEVDAFFHCGDSELTAGAKSLENINTVRGNCDFGDDFPEEIIKEVKGFRIFAAHGHLLNVKMNEMNLVYKAEENKADIICFGHTHIPIALERAGRILINPGSMRLPRQVNIGTYVIVEADETTVDVAFYSLKGEKQDYLSKKFPVNY